MCPHRNYERIASTTFHPIHSLLGFETLWKSHMTTSGNHLIRQRPTGNDCMTRKRRIGSFRWDRGCYDITPPPPQRHSITWAPQQVVRQATGHTVGIQKEPEKPIVFVHVDDLKLCPGPQDISWVPGVPTAKSLCASTVAFRPGSHVSDITPDPSVDVSDWDVTKAGFTHKYLSNSGIGPTIWYNWKCPVAVLLSPAG